MGRGNEPEGGYLIEFIQMGHVVKVTAIDPRTGREVSIVGDPAAGKTALTRLAVRKMEYVKNKK